MPENNKIQKFLQKLTPCIERGDLNACVEEAARLAEEMGIGAGELMELSTDRGMNSRYDFAYVLALAAAQGLEGKGKAGAYYNAGLAAHYLKKVEKAEQCYKISIYGDPKLAVAHSGWAYVQHLEQHNRAKKEFEQAHKLDPQNVKVIRNIRALGKVRREPEISKLQWCMAIALFIGIIAAWYFFWKLMLSETVFSALFIILTAMLIFILFYHQLGKFKAGPIEFEMSTEHRSQPSETIAKIER